MLGVSRVPGRALGCLGVLRGRLWLPRECVQRYLAGGAAVAAGVACALRLRGRVFGALRVPCGVASGFRRRV
ncbi:hypothetical protein AQJ46_20600 [Streptomyces canus]|uniref:Uncharacterized protein n=1 Tax=Streptomyces canus TaxID=58343 RepID=A0A117R3G3_9ACTN|nr:hypothetical protein AQJ46_20600 [Streptomyces canus]